MGRIIEVTDNIQISINIDIDEYVEYISDDILEEEYLERGFDCNDDYEETGVKEAAEIICKGLSIISADEVRKFLNNYI